MIARGSECGSRGGLRGWTRAWSVPAASAVDVGVALSLGMYYTCTYFGRAVVPLPGAVALGGALQYYLAVGQIQDTRVQAWLWVGSYVVAGLLWRTAVSTIGRLRRAETGYLDVAKATWVWGLVLCLPGPFVAWHLGAGEGGFGWEDLVAACLRRQFSSVPGWLLPVYFPAALLAMVGELRALWGLLAPLPGAERLLVLAVSAVATLVGIVAVGELARVTGVPTCYLAVK